MRILLAIGIFLSGSAAFAQQQQKSPLPSFTAQGPVKIMTTEEANRLNGVAHPMIDGISYEQYKAQQESLKAQAAAKQAAAANNPGGLTLSKNTAAPATNTVVPETPVSTPAAKAAGPVEVTIPVQQVTLGQTAKLQQ